MHNISDGSGGDYDDAFQIIRTGDPLGSFQIYNSGLCPDFTHVLMSSE